MAIKRQTEGTLLLPDAGGTGAKVAWVVGGNELHILQGKPNGGGSATVKLTGPQFKELMEASMEIYQDMQPKQGKV